MTVKLKSQFQNQEWRANQENVDLGTTGEAKRVVLFDSNGNELTPGSFGSGIVTGTKTVATAGSAQRITATPTAIKGVWVNADIIAGIVVVVGDSSVVANVSGQKGIILIPGNDPIFLQITDLSLLYVDAQSNGGKLAYAYLT